MKRVALAATAAFMVATAPAYAQAVTAANPQSVADALQSAGYRAVLGRDSVGDPQIETAASGVRWFIYFFGCEKGTNCSTVTFRSGWSDASVKLDKINEWNRDKRFSRAYLDKEGDPILELDVNLDEGGMSRALFIDNVEFFETSLGAFVQFIR